MHLQVLDQGVKQRSQSVGNLDFTDQSREACVQELIDEIISMVVVEKSPQTEPQEKAVAKVRVCHQCHAPANDGVHAGAPCGVGRCPLQHWQGCVGGISGGKDEKGKVWAACQEETSDESGDESENDDGSDTYKEDTAKLPANTRDAASVFVTDFDVEEFDDSSSDDEDLRQQRADLERLQREVDQQTLLASARDARKEEREKKRMKKKAEIARQMKVLKEKQSVLATSPFTANSGISSSKGGSTPLTADADLKRKVAEHESKKNSKQAAKKAATKLVDNNGITIGGIRAIPDVRQEVEGYITQLKSLIPSLSSDPTAGGFDAAHRTGGHLGGHAAGAGDTTQYVYVAELGRAIPMVSSMKDLPTFNDRSEDSLRTRPIISESSDTDSECSEDESCSLRPEPGMRFCWKKHDDGRKFFKPVPVIKSSAAIHTSYVLNKNTGNYEQKLIQKKSKRKDLQPANKKVINDVLNPSLPLYKDHRIVHNAGLAAPLRKAERQSSFVLGDSEKQGKESRCPSLIQFARDCPVSWTSKTTTSSLNPILYSWAYISELLATRTGQAPSLQDGELEARLQHFLSVLEVTLQTTTQSDFASDSWKVARLYNQKVQDKIDAGVYSWIGLSQQWGTATLPHELMAANAELAPRVIRKTVDRKEDDKKEYEKKDYEKKVCSTWNSCDTRGKCKWEVENNGKKCYRQHFCSWCKTELRQTNEHQKTFCKKRQEKEGE